jgi:CheY-like chemotaxis protein
MSLPEFFFERVTGEIRQQMDGVLALAERMSRQHLTPDAQACVAGVAEAAASVTRILNDATDLRTSAFHGMTLDAQPTRLRELMDEVQARWQARASQGGVTLLVAYDGDPEACALIDGPRLVQVFDGFIAQAMAGARSGAVEATLRAVTLEDSFRLEGRIRGGGPRGGLGEITPADIIDIEAKFGLETALGVALGWRIIKALDGKLRSEANAGAGETLVFELAAPRAIQAGDEPEPMPQPSRAAHILVVDDNATNRMVAETLCAMFDCTAESAVDGLEAVEAARTGRFDLILMDIKMPRMDGVAATKAIRGLEGQAGRVPIIALTANADPDDAQAYLAAGMNGVVEKPMKPENLLQALQAALGDGDAAAAA